MIGCLRTRVRTQPIIALYFESETDTMSLGWATLRNNGSQGRTLQIKMYFSPRRFFLSEQTLQILRKCYMM